MNEGSSRSHCAIMLTLLTLDARTRMYKQTQFSIVDLAGAERPEKALGERRVRYVTTQLPRQAQLKTMVSANHAKNEG